MKSRMVIFLVLIITINLAAVPATINFQGAIKDADGLPVNDTQFMEFRIYDLNSLLWSEQHLAVEIVDGIFSVELGQFSPFPQWLLDIPDLYITFFYGGEEMTPWQKLNSVPYAIEADNSNQIEDVPLSGLVQQDMNGNAAITGTMSADSFVGDGSGITNIGSFDDMYVNTTGPDAISANSSAATLTLENDGSGNGLEITSAGEDGVYIDTAGDDGVFVYQAGMTSTHNTISAANGFEISGAGGCGLYVGHTNWNGIKIQSATYDGVRVDEAGDYGVWANTTDSSGEWGLYTNDKVYGTNITTRNQSTHVRYIGNEILESGDLVCIAGGYEENALDEDDELPIVKVTKANSDNSEAVLGVVEYKVYIYERIEAMSGGKTKINMSFRYAEGSISSGDYLSIITFGPADVKVGNNSNIKTGEKLTVADTGYTRSINDEDNWRIGILGKALEDSNRKGKIKVFVNCR